MMGMDTFEKYVEFVSGALIQRRSREKSRDEKRSPIDSPSILAQKILTCRPQGVVGS
jgi:hypothetical protein